MTEVGAVVGGGFFGVSWVVVAAALLASLLSGIVGTLVVLRRLVALGGGIAHAAFGGIGLAVVLGLSPRLGAAAVAVATAWVLARRQQGGSDRQDAVIGVLWAVGMALGMLLLAGAPSGDRDVEGYLFGDIAAVGVDDLIGIALVALAVTALFALLRRELIATAFDVEHASLQGLPVRGLQFLLLLLVGLSVVALLAVVGVVLAIALLAIPPLVALRLCRGLGTTMVVGSAVGAAVSLIGLVLAVQLGWPAGPTIVLVGGVALALTASVARRPLRPA